MNVLGIIPARGKSKGIPRKNLAEINGKSLLAITAKMALASNRLSRVILSTDCCEIAAVGRHCGLEVPFMRPDDLAEDETRAISVVWDVVKRLPGYDAVMILQPTNPLRLTSDIDGAISLMERTGCDSVISGAEVGECHPARMHMTDGEGRIKKPSFAEAYDGQPRQFLPKLRIRDGAIYLTKIHLLQQGLLIGGDCREWTIPVERAWNVNTAVDLKICEALMPGAKT